MANKPKLWQDVDLEKRIAVIQPQGLFGWAFIKQGLDKAGIQTISPDVLKHDFNLRNDIIDLLKYIKTKRNKPADFLFLEPSNSDWRILYDNFIEYKLVKFGVSRKSDDFSCNTNLYARLQSIPGAIQGGEEISLKKAVKNKVIFNSFDKANKSKGIHPIKPIGDKENLKKPFNSRDWAESWDPTAHDPLLDEVYEEVQSLIATEEKPLKNHCYVIWGPSGAGKTTLITHLLRYMSHIKSAYKITTRPQRGKNADDNTITISKRNFKQLTTEERLVATCKYNHELYGYSRKQIETNILQGNDMFVDIVDMYSTLELKKAFPDYVKIITMECEPEMITGFLNERLNNTETDKQTLKKLTLDHNQRIRLLTEKYTIYDKFMQNADYVLKDEPFMFKQRTLRRYINQCRKSNIISYSPQPQTL